MKNTRSLLPLLARQKFPILAWLFWGLISVAPHLTGLGTWTDPLMGLIGVLMFVLMLGCVFTVVHYADELADSLGEPYGTLVLTLSATAIEVSLLLLVMLQGDQNPTLLRDTVYATLMVALNGLVGLSLTAGGWHHVEQAFNLRGALSYLHIIAPLSLLILVLPNFTVTSAGPTLAPTQEAFLGVLCVFVYGVFLRLQTGRHRAHYDHIAYIETDETEGQGGAEDRPAMSRLHILGASSGLLVALLPIVLLSEHLAGLINFAIEEMHLPTALGGLLVTSLVLAPEGMGAFRAALGNRVQRSINLCLGSALSTIALTIPTVLIASAMLGHVLMLGVKPLDMTMLYATLIAVCITFVSGRANLLQGTVHLMLFATYLFFIFIP